MGYQRSTLKLLFEDPEFDGLEVKMRRLSMGAMFSVQELADIGEDIKQQVEQFDHLIEIVAGGLISWNLTEGDDETLVAPTKQGLYSQDIDLLMAIVGAWLDAIKVPRPLPSGSNSGAPSPELFELMEQASASPPN